MRNAWRRAERREPLPDGVAHYLLEIGQIADMERIATRLRFKDSKYAFWSRGVLDGGQIGSCCATSLEYLNLLFERSWIRDCGQVYSLGTCLVYRRWWHIHSNEPDLAFSTQILDGGRIHECKMAAAHTHTASKQNKQTCGCNDGDPIPVQPSRLVASPLCKEICRGYQSVHTEQRGVEGKQNESLEAVFANNATHPRAEMVHLGDAAVKLAAMVGSVGFRGVAS